MQKSDRIGPPRDVRVEEEWRYDEEAGKVMNDERFLADSVTSIDDVLDGNIVDVVDPGEYEENSREVVSP